MPADGSGGASRGNNTVAFRQASPVRRGLATAAIGCDVILRLVFERLRTGGGDMKKLVSVLMALMVTPLVAAGSDVAGQWTSGKHSTVPVELQLLSSGATLTGTVRLGSGPAVDILDGKVVRHRITFK